ncbi:isopenicillin n epimerase acyl-CoA racemase component [Aspergillus pseudoustus]|uniref:Isopenicillin n epimerase acyl-CoA racemase component n=1 Tax=Aspergillus pseudoustus TaxID=1810923 RepID=A0ABR4J2A4_9EURO
MYSPPPLTGIRVLEFAGLAPGPFAGMMLADWGASVLRVDRVVPHGQEVATGDLLTRRKSSIMVNLKSQSGIDLIKELAQKVDVLIDPFRPGVLEKLGLDPEQVLLPLNPRLIVARMTGFRRDGRYSRMAGHDINYIAVSGVLGMLGPVTSRPLPPANLMGDFAGGGLMCFLGIVLALLGRVTTGSGQVIEANMVDGSSYIATSPRLAHKTQLWNKVRGTNLLDGGCPYYDVYETKDGLYVAVGALEPQFFSRLLQGLDVQLKDLPGNREDPANWPFLSRLFKAKFLSKTRREWESVFDGTDACVTPVLTYAELEKNGFDQRPAVTLKSTPALAVSADMSGGAARGQGLGVPGSGWISEGLVPGHGGEQLLEEWTAWKKGKDYKVENNGLVKIASAYL